MTKTEDQKNEKPDESDLEKISEQHQGRLLKHQVIKIKLDPNPDF